MRCGTTSATLRHLPKLARSPCMSSTFRSDLVWFALEKCVSMKWSTKQTGADFSLRVSVHAAPRLKLLCSTHWQSVWELLTQPNRATARYKLPTLPFKRQKKRISRQNALPFAVVDVSLRQPGKTPKAATLPQLAQHLSVSSRFKLARHVSLNCQPSAV